MGKPEFFDTAVVDEAKKKHESLTRRQVNDIKHIVDSPEGRRFYFGLLSESGIFNTSFTGNSTTFFLEGRRDVGLVYLRKLMQASPKSFPKMMFENFSEINSYKKKQEKKK